MSASLLAELSHLFSVEALETDERDADEADRLWSVAAELNACHGEALLRELRQET